jgi:hypothetical protein
MTKQKTKYGIVTMLKATDPVVKAIRQKAKAVHYEPHPTRARLIFGSQVGIAAFIGGVLAAARWMRRPS